MAILLPNTASNYIRASTVPSYDAAYTVMWWVCFPTLPSEFDVMFDFAGDSNDYDQIWTNTSFEMQLEVADSGAGSTTADSGTPFVAGQWRHMTMRRNSASSLDLLIDAAVRLQNTSAVSARPTPTITFNADASGGAPMGNFRLAYVRVWDAALTNQEIRAEMASPVAVRRANLYVDCRLDNMGDLIDRGGHGRHLTRTGTGLSTVPGPTLPQWRTFLPIWTRVEPPSGGVTLTIDAAAAWTVAASAPGLAATLSPGVGAWSWSAPAPTPVVRLPPGAGAWTVAAEAPGLGMTLAQTVAAWAWSAPTATPVVSLAPSPGSWAIGAPTPGLLTMLAQAAAAWSWSAPAPGLAAQLGPGAAPWTVSAPTPTLGNQQTLTIDAAAAWAVAASAPGLAAVLTAGAAGWEVSAPTPGLATTLGQAAAAWSLAAGMPVLVIVLAPGAAAWAISAPTPTLTDFAVATVPPVTSTSVLVVVASTSTSVAPTSASTGSGPTSSSTIA